MTTTQTKLLVIGASLVVALYGVSQISLVNKREEEKPVVIETVATHRASQAEWEQKVVNLKPEHDKWEKTRSEAETKISEIETQATDFRQKAKEEKDKADAMVDPVVK